MLRNSVAGGRGRWGRLVVVALALGALAASRPSAQPATSPSTYSFTIPAGPLGRAVEDYSALTGVTVLYEQPADSGLTSPGVSGRLSPQDALRALLAGTRLQPRFTDERDVILVPAPHEHGASDAVAPLPSPDEPVLALDTLHAEAPPVRLGQWVYDDYARLLQQNIRRAIGKSLKTRPAPYRVALQIWIDPSGRISRATLAEATERRQLDAALLAIVTTITVDRPPPRGLLQPITVEVSAREGF